MKYFWKTCGFNHDCDVFSFPLFFNSCEIIALLWVSNQTWLTSLRHPIKDQVWQKTSLQHCFGLYQYQHQHHHLNQHQHQHQQDTEYAIKWFIKINHPS